MKKVLALILAAVMLFCATGCGLFSDDSAVRFEDLYTHKDPDGLKYDERKTYINKDFGATVEEELNAAAYPDQLVYDEEGNVIGMYDYDPETGISSGWTDITTGEYFEEETDLGKPDESLMVTLSGNVTVGCVVYGNEGKAVASYVYVFLGDASDKEAVESYVSDLLGYEMKEETEKVLLCTQDENEIDSKFSELEELYGQVQADRSAEGYGENLKLDFGLKTYGVNPYKPYSGAKDPEGLGFDEKTVLTSAGAYSFTTEALEEDLEVRTDVVYGRDGKAVAHCIYYEFKSKEGADKLMNSSGSFFSDSPERLSDTVILDYLDEQKTADIINSYIGYGVLEDDSFDAYVENVEETYFMMIYEQ